MRDYIESDYKITEYDNGAVVKQLIPQGDPETIEPTPEPYQPTNTEIAQQIEDLRADLIIAGVI